MFIILLRVGLHWAFYFGGMKQNKIAKDLRTPKYRKRVVEDKKKKIKRMKMFEILERFR